MSQCENGFEPLRVLLQYDMWQKLLKVFYNATSGFELMFAQTSEQRLQSACRMKIKNIKQKGT